MNLGASHQQTLNLFQIYYTRLQTNLFFENDVYTICWKAKHVSIYILFETRLCWCRRPVLSIDLWACAAAKLRPEDRLNINFSYPNKLQILSDLRELTERSRQECINKRWRYTRKSGETIIFVDLFSKVIKWIDLFKQVGDTVVQYDPVHAALPWAGVRFLLQVCNNI